jgi:hypothetical protein
MCRSLTFVSGFTPNPPDSNRCCSQPMRGCGLNLAGDYEHGSRRLQSSDSNAVCLANEEALRNWKNIAYVASHARLRHTGCNAKHWLCLVDGIVHGRRVPQHLKSATIGFRGPHEDQLRPPHVARALLRSRCGRFGDRPSQCAAISLLPIMRNAQIAVIDRSMRVAQLVGSAGGFAVKGSSKERQPNQGPPRMTIRKQR